jgi:alpha-1,3-glucan synthase
LLAVLTRYAKVHSWLLPVFAIGLGAPRWCQMLWGTSGIGLNMAWAGKIGPFLGSALWLYLGVLDNIQGVGLGMLLLTVSDSSLPSAPLPPSLIPLSLSCRL